MTAKLTTPEAVSVLGAVVTVLGNIMVFFVSRGGLPMTTMIRSVSGAMPPTFFRLAYFALLIQLCVASLQSDLAAAGVLAYFPGSSNYNQARLAFNRRFDIQPAAIAYPISSSQVSSAILAGKTQNIPVVARSGGHSYTANGIGGTNGALVIDLSKLKAISVNTNTNQATIQTGNRLGDIALILNSYGRAMPHGTCPYVGVGGLTAHGGYGFTSRKWGLTLDGVVAAEVVLADGSVQVASPTSNSELFWAIRGAAPSFGIVTSFTVKVYPVPSSTFFNYGWDLSASDTAKAITRLQNFVQTGTLPASLGLEMQFWSSWRQGYVYVSLTGAWYDQPSQLTAVLKPFLDTMPAPSSKTVQTQGWIDHLITLAGDGSSLNTTLAPDVTDTFYAKSLTTPDNAALSAASITAFANYMANQGFNSGTSWFVQMDVFGGANSAINAAGPDDTAYPWRRSLFNFQFYASSPNYQPPYPNVGFSFMDSMVNSIIGNNPTTWNYGGYANYIDERNAEWRRAYYSNHYTRLRSLKASIDPSNVFRFPTSVEL